MTYYELLENTAKKKADAVRKLNQAINGKLGFLCKAEIERNPGGVAYLWLAKEFCEALAENIDQFMDQVGSDSLTAMEIADIYMAYYDNDPNLYDYLPVEAQLFAE